MTTQAKQKLAVAIAAALAVGVLVYLALPGVFGKRTQQNTNDAFVSADYTLVVPRVAGFIKEVLVEDNQQVKAGQLLALIDDRDLRASAEAADAQTLVARAQLQNAKATLERQTSVIAQAQASVVSAKAEMAFAQQELNRYNHLAGVGAGTVQNAQQARTRIDQATAHLDTATAKLAAERKQVDILTAQRDAAEGSLKHAQAALEIASFELSYTRITAPQDGMIGERAVRVGAYVTPGSKLLAVVPLQQAYVVANFQETQLTDVQPGQEVQVRVDSLGGEALSGRVESIAPATGVTFAAVKPDNATGNFTKVVQRIPVKIMLEPGQPLAERLRVGMSVEASIDTGSSEKSVREVTQRWGLWQPLTFSALLAVSLTACTVGPDFHKPETTQIADWSKPAKSAPSQAVSEPLNERWWEVFHDAQLSALTQRAVQSNLDLQLASSRLQQSRAARQVISADRYPNTAATGSYARERNSGKGLNDPSGYNGDSAFNLWDAGFSASWELDFWGRVRRETEAADANLEVAENDRRGVLLAVLADTAQNYIQLRGVQNTRAVTEQNLDVARHSLKLSQLRLADGVATDLDVAEAAAQVAAIESRLPALEQRQSQLINAISLLMGEPPQALAKELSTDAAVPQSPLQVGIGLPSQLADRRPDIRQAEARLHAATANIGVAKGDFYPRITLSGNLGSQAMQLSDFGSWGSRAFGIGPQFSLPLFDGGRLRGMLQLREAQQQEAAIAYQQTVLRAWHEIDDQLTAYNASQRRRDSLAEAVRQNQIALRTAQQQYVEGVVDFVNVLTVQGALLATQEQWVESSTGVSLAMVGLYKALGGGWESVYPAEVPTNNPV